MHNEGPPISHSSQPPPDIPPAADSYSLESLGQSASGLFDQPINDIGNAEVFAALNRATMAFVPGLGGWMFYNGRYWLSGEYEAVSLAAETIKVRIKAIENLAADDGTDTQKKALAALARLDGCSYDSRLNGMLRLAKAKLHISATAFDSNPYLFNVANGTIDLRTGGLLPHNPVNYITKWSPIEYSADASSELWNETISIIAYGDKELADFLQLIGGYSLLGEARLQHFIYFLGNGCNGKSLLTGLWEKILGGFEICGYAVRIPNGTILNRSERSAGGPSPDIMALKGKRLALLSEQCADKPLNTERIKDFTGGDSLTAREPHGRQVTFKPSHTLICNGNHIPSVNASDHGFWRRFLVVPFRGQFRGNSITSHLHLLHTSEHLSAILTWMVKGARRICNDEWFVPDVVIRATKSCQEEGDLLRQWIGECCEPGMGKEWTTLLYQSYTNWCQQRNEDHLSQSMFTRRMQQLGYQKHTSNGKPRLVGIKLASPGIEPPVPPSPPSR